MRCAGGRGPEPRRRPAAQPGHLRHDLDGAGSAADHRREPAPELHRPCRVPDLGRDRAALRPHAGRPVQRPWCDDGLPHPGVLRGDHARRPFPEVEVEGAPRGSGPLDGPTEPRLRRRRPRGVGEVLSLLRRRATDRPARGGQVHDRPRGRRATSRREHDRRRGRPRDHLHWSHGRHRRHQQPAARRQEPARPGHPPPRGRRQRRVRVAVPLPRLTAGTSGSSRCARSTCQVTSTGSSTRESAG